MGIFNLPSILISIYYFIFTNKHIEELSKERLSICKDCPYNSLNKYIGTNKQAYCTICTCVLELKTRVPDEECPLGKWQKVKLKFLN